MITSYKASFPATSQQVHLLRSLAQVNVEGRSDNRRGGEGGWLTELNPTYGIENYTLKVCLYPLMRGAYSF
jgi:hypothetical protein